MATEFEYARRTTDRVRRPFVPIMCAAIRVNPPDRCASHRCVGMDAHSTQIDAFQVSWSDSPELLAVHWVASTRFDVLEHLLRVGGAPGYQDV